MAELEAMKAQAEIEEQNKELAQKIFEAWGKGDFETIKEFIAPDYVYFSPSISSKPISRDESIEMGKMLRKAFPDINWKMKELIAEEDRVVTRWVFGGAHEGEFQGISAIGNKVEVSGIIISHTENGKVIEGREEIDQLDLMMQLGMEFKPKEEEK